MRYLEFLEKKQHGSEDYRLQFYPVEPNHPRYVMSCHWHPEYEILLLTEGKMPVYLDGKKCEMSAGDLLWITGGTLHSAPVPGGRYQCLVFDFAMLCGGGSRCRHALEPLASRNLFMESSHMEESLRTALTALMHDAAEPGEIAQLRTVGSLCRFAASLREQYEAALPVSLCDGDKKHIRQLKNALSYIESHYQEPIALDDLAGAAGLSPKYFCRIFSALTQRTPMEYLCDYRIERACYALSVLGLSALDAAYSCGFNDLSYFIRIFKRRKGMTPGKYRLLCAANERDSSCVREK